MKLKNISRVLLSLTLLFSSVTHSFACTVLAIKDVLIYTKYIRELCLKKSGMNQKDPPTVHVIGKLENLIIGKTFLKKYLEYGKEITSFC